jgi:hypothetical protein
MRYQCHNEIFPFVCVDTYIMPPIISRLTFSKSSNDPETWVHIISDLLTPSECTSLISKHDDALVSHNVTLTLRKRKVFDDEDLADLLWSRLSPFFGTQQIIDEDESSWTASHLSTRFRYCKYEAGGSFEPHFDGRRLAGVDEQSFMTVNMYLNDVPSEHGGSTRILTACDKCTGTKSAPREHEVLGKVPPVAGLAAVFRDSLFHDGEVLGGGVKCLLRTDVMFQRDEPFDLDRVCEGLSAEEKGKKALGLAVKLEDGNNFDGAIAWYKKAYRLNPALETGEG